MIPGIVQFRPVGVTGGLTRCSRSVPFPGADDFSMGLCIDMAGIAERLGRHMAEHAAVIKGHNVQLMAAHTHVSDIGAAIQRSRRRHVGCAAMAQAAILRSTCVGMAGQTALFRIAAFIV